MAKVQSQLSSFPRVWPIPSHNLSEQLLKLEEIYTVLSLLCIHLLALGLETNDLILDIPNIIFYNCTKMIFLYSKVMSFIIPCPLHCDTVPLNITFWPSWIKRAKCLPCHEVLCHHLLCPLKHEGFELDQ